MLSVHGRVRRQTVSEGQRGVSRETREEGDWQGSNTNRY